MTGWNKANWRAAVGSPIGRFWLSSRLRIHHGIGSSNCDEPRPSLFSVLSEPGAFFVFPGAAPYRVWFQGRGLIRPRASAMSCAAP